MTTDYQMDGDIDRTATSKSDAGVELYAYCTEENVHVGFSGNDTDSAVWMPRQQVIEFIGILSHIVYSRAKAVEITPPKPAANLQSESDMERARR
jgi:hypothetical protein